MSQIDIFDGLQELLEKATGPIVDGHIDEAWRSLSSIVFLRSSIRINGLRGPKESKPQQQSERARLQAKGFQHVKQQILHTQRSRGGILHSNLAKNRHLTSESYRSGGDLVGKSFKDPQEMFWRKPIGSPKDLA